MSGLGQRGQFLRPPPQRRSGWSEAEWASDSQGRFLHGYSPGRDGPSVGAMRREEAFPCSNEDPEAGLTVCRTGEAVCLEANATGWSAVQVADDRVCSRAWLPAVRLVSQRDRGTAWRAAIIVRPPGHGGFSSVSPRSEVRQRGFSSAFSWTTLANSLTSGLQGQLHGVFPAYAATMTSRPKLRNVHRWGSSRASRELVARNCRVG